MKKPFKEPILEIIQFSTEDILTASVTLQGDDWGDVDWLQNMK